MMVQSGAVLYFAGYLLLFFRRLRGRGAAVLISRTLFFAYLCGVVQVTFFPLWLSTGLSRFFPHDYGSLIPFEDLALALTVHTRPLFESMRELALNLLLLLPLGIFLPALTRRKRFARVLAAVFGCSFAIESLQFLLTAAGFFYRSFDITDLLTNTAGGCLGYALYRLAAPALRREKDARRAK